jgi:hypothetical protein
MADAEQVGELADRFRRFRLNLWPPEREPFPLLRWWERGDPHVVLERQCVKPG